MGYPDYEKKSGGPVLTWDEVIGQATKAATATVATETTSIEQAKVWSEVAPTWTSIANAMTQRDQAASQAKLAQATVDNLKAVHQSLAVQREGLDLLKTEAEAGR
jgi:hypothetical protein